MKQLKTTNTNRIHQERKGGSSKPYMHFFNCLIMYKQNSLFLRTVNMQNHTAVFGADGGLF